MLTWLHTWVSPYYYVTMHTQLVWTPELVDIDDPCEFSGGFKWYGNASYVVGPPGGTFYDTQPFSPGVQDLSDEERRGSVCILGQVFGIPYVGCTAHMRANDNWARPQFLEYVQQDINFRITGSNAHAVWWGGDMNIQPTEIPVAVPGWSYSVHREADRCGGSGTNLRRITHRDSNPPHATLKLDYVFRSGPGSVPICTSVNDAILWPETALLYLEGQPTYSSDHKIETGSWR